MKNAKRLGCALAVLGIWEASAPFVLGYASTSILAQEVVIGIVWITFGLWIALTHRGEAVKWLGWIGALIGLWLTAAPGILGYQSIAAAFWNDLLVGFAGMVLGAWAAFNAPEDEPSPAPLAHH